MIEKLILLSEFFNEIDKFPWNYALYLPKDFLWDVDTNCLVLDPENSEDPDDPDDDPVLAKENNMRYVLIVQDVESIVNNAKLQVGLATKNQLIKALKYYVDNDAYIEF